MKPIFGLFFGLSIPSKKDGLFRSQESQDRGRGQNQLEREETEDGLRVIKRFRLVW